MVEPPDDLAELSALLRSIDGRSYGAYKRLARLWRLDTCDLRVDRVQGDPFAAPSSVSLLVDPATAALPPWALSTLERRISTADFLLRRLILVARDIARPRGSGRSGRIDVTPPLQEVLARSSVQVAQDGAVEARLRVGLPASGRRVLGHEAAALLMDDLPDVVEDALRADTLDLSALERHIHTVEDQQALRGQLAGRKLVAFIADGAVLPRASGVDPGPMTRGAVPTVAPTSLAVSLTTPHSGSLRGLGIPEGLTLVVGGGYHGKSTLLKAIELGVYDHIPDDGRERVVTRSDAVKVRAEDGRAVTGLDISAFIGALPGGGDTTCFSTIDASGSTSQAAAIVEARAIGSQLLLIDEDTSATNLLIRDARMAALVGADKEPITPLIRRITGLRAAGCSLILVVGGTGDYFAQADTVIWMDHWRAADATEAAQALAADEAASDDPPRLPRVIPWQCAHSRIQLRDHKGRLRVRTDEVRRLTLGDAAVDLRALEQLVDPGQARAAGLALALVADALRSGAPDVKAALDLVAERLHQGGLDALSAQPRGDLATPRPYEIAAILARLRTPERA